MEYCDRGDLCKHIKATKKLKRRYGENQIFQWFKQLTEALHYIHKKNIVHRDLKTSNVFLHAQYNKNEERIRLVVKLGDFGIARVLERSIYIYIYINHLLITYYI